MQRLEIKLLGPVSECNIEIRDYLVFTGAQASGKSTIAKSIFFFNNIKNLLIQLIRRMNLMKDEETIELSLGLRLKREIRSNFLQIFGTTLAMDPQMSMTYTYENGETITLYLTDNQYQKNFAEVKISQGMWRNILALERSVNSGLYSDPAEIKHVIESKVFCNDYEIVYIPAGRSLMTLLSSQINYFYSTLDDVQKRSIDYCTQNYLERILRMKTFFTDGYTQLIHETKTTTDIKINLDALGLAADLAFRILKGEYKNISGDERLQISDKRYVKINYASSGQQESVWILNVLFYYLLNKIKAHFIIEEPESHLFPDAQKLIVEFITLVKNQNNMVTMTTHSPYVLGSINNLLYAEKISDEENQSEVDRIIPKILWLKYDSMGAYFLEHGRLTDMRNDEFMDIDHDVIDGASQTINSAYEEMVEIDLKKGKAYDTQ